MTVESVPLQDCQVINGHGNILILYAGRATSTTIRESFDACIPARINAYLHGEISAKLSSPIRTAFGRFDAPKY